jgi:hypothetical protein
MLATVERKGKYIVSPNEAEGKEGWSNTAARLTGRRKESDPAGVILFVMDGPSRLPFPYRTGCPWQELLSCEVMEFPAAVIL